MQIKQNVRALPRKTILCNESFDGSFLLWFFSSQKEIIVQRWKCNKKTRKEKTLKESCSSLEINSQTLVNLKGCTNQIELTHFVVFSIYDVSGIFFKFVPDGLRPAFLLQVL